MEKYNKLSKEVRFFYEIEDDRIYIEEITTKEEFRGQGLARKELLNFISWAKGLDGIKSIYLCGNPLDDTTEEQRLFDFYESLDFVNDGNDVFELIF